MNATKSTVTYRRAGLFETILSVGNNGAGTIFYMLMMQASYIASEGYGVAIAAVSIFLTVARIFDGFTDSIFGALFDKFSPSKGKLRIWLFGGYALETLAAFMLYDWAASKVDGVAGFFMFVVLYFVFLIGYTINNVAGGAIGITLTNDPKQRPMIGVVGTLYSYVVPMVLSTVQSFVILPKYDNQFNAAMLREMTYWYAGIGLFFVLISVIGLRKKDIRENFLSMGDEKTGAKAEKVKFKDMFALLKSNRNLQMYIVSTASDKLAQQTASVSYVNVLLAGMLIGSYQASTMIGNFTMIIGIAFAFIGGAYTGRKGAKKTTSLFSWLSIAVSGGLVVFCAILYFGTGSMTSIGVFGPAMIIYAVFMLAKTGFQMVLTTATAAMTADVTDGWLDETGKYLPGVVAGVKSFLDKFISAFSTTIAGFAIMLVGYSSTKVPQAGDPVNTGVFILTMFLAFGLPILGWLCNVVAMKFYTLDYDEMAAVQQRISDKKAAIQAAEKAAE